MIRKSRLMGLIVLFLINSTISATNVNGRFVVVGTDSSHLSLLLQLNTNTGIDAMGGATIVIEFDTVSTTFKSNPIINIDYIFHNFSGGNYSPATITRPMSNKIWINIDLPFNQSNGGIIVAGGDNWTDVATIFFDIVNHQGLASFLWMTNSNFWGIYDDDNLTLWGIGQFENQVNFIIPVELTSFTASLLNNDFVELKWITATSLNNLGFEVEKDSSPSGQNQGNTLPHQVWEKIGFVENLDNSTFPIEYSFTDNTMHNSSVVKYRLKIVDLDGSFSYSDVVDVETVLTNFELAQNYPNPFNPCTKINWQSPVGGHQTIKVYDVLGNEIATLVDEFKPAGRHEVEFNSSSVYGGLASGVYIYRLQTTESTETKKMVLLR